MLAMAPVRDPDDLLCGRRDEARHGKLREAAVHDHSYDVPLLLKHTGIKGHGHCPAIRQRRQLRETALGRSRRSRSTDGRRVRTLVPHPPHKTVEVGPTGAVQQGDLPPTKIIGNTDRCKSSDSISMAGNSATPALTYRLRPPASTGEQGGADLAA